MLRRKGFHHVRILKGRRRFGPHEVIFKEGGAYVIHAGGWRAASASTAPTRSPHPR